MDGYELEPLATQGFVSKQIFKHLLLIGFFCAGVGFIIDLSIPSIEPFVTISVGVLFLYFVLLLFMINRIDLHINMRLAFAALLIWNIVELLFDTGGMIWSIVLPPIAFAAFGKKEGGIWSISNFILITSWLMLDRTSPGFSNAEISNVILAYIVITLVSYFYTSHIDRTHQLMLEQAQKQERLEMAQTLSGGVAHLINNEMQVIIGSASTLTRTLHEPANIKKMNRIVEFAFKASNHANQLLAYAENSPEYMQEHDLKNILIPLSNSWSDQLPELMQLHIRLPEQFPICLCDPKQIHHVLNIIFENAKEACHPSGTITLQASSEDVQQNISEPHLKKGNYIKISIHDNGVGIQGSNLDKIFEPFFSTKFTGRGLGLAAAHGIVKQHGGIIQAQSSKEDGTILAVFLPVLALT